MDSGISFPSHFEIILYLFYYQLNYDEHNTKKIPLIKLFVVRPPNDPNAGEVCSKFELKYLSGYTVLICY